MDDASTVGARLRVLRKWRKFSQQELADLSGFSQSFLSQVERGRMALDRRSHIASLATALKVSEADIVGGPHLSDDPYQLEAYAAIPALRVALQTSSMVQPVIDRARPLAELVTERNTTVERLIRLCDYRASGMYLPSLIEELHFHAHVPVDESALRLTLKTLLEAYVNAAEMARHAGQHDLALYASSQAMQAANILDDPVQQGKAAMWTLLTMPHEGTPGLIGWERTHIAARRAVDNLEPHAKKPEAIEVLGMLVLMTSLTAAAMKRHDAAKSWLDEAGALATRVNDDIDHNWMGFSTTNVGVWRVAVGVERGESGNKMLGLAESIHPGKDVVDPDDFGVVLDDYRSRKASLLSDVGRGMARERKTQTQAVDWLRRAEDAAPSFIRYNTRVRHSIEVLLSRSLPATARVELRGMAARMGIPH
jgi:transcriptional regulator with XRE-family HTH domain